MRIYLQNKKSGSLAVVLPKRIVEGWGWQRGDKVSARMGAAKQSLVLEKIRGCEDETAGQPDSAAPADSQSVETA